MDLAFSETGITVNNQCFIYLSDDFDAIYCLMALTDPFKYIHHRRIGDIPAFINFEQTIIVRKNEVNDVSNEVALYI